MACCWWCAAAKLPRRRFTRTRELLMSVKCRMLGVVLNAVDSSSPDYYYSYRYYPYVVRSAIGRDDREIPQEDGGNEGSLGCIAQL